MRSAIREHLINLEDLSAKGNCQTSQALLLYFDIFDESEREKAYAKLIEIIEGDDRHLTTGVIGLRYIFEVLIGGGDVDLALELITRPDEPSYGSMIERGATALCESLDTNGLNESENHHFLGDILRVFVSLIAGLRVNPDLTDKDSFLFAPAVTSKLDYAKAEYDFTPGKVVCGWEREDGCIRFYADVPEGVIGRFSYNGYTAELVPGKNEFTV
jgi:alpha-L-rhamnosidase